MTLLLVLPISALPSVAEEQKKVPIQPLGLLDIGGALYTRVESVSDKRVTETATTKTTTTEDELIFEEGIELSVEGYIYHPYLLEWRLGLDLAKTQETITLNDLETKTNGDLRGYDISALLLQEKPVSLRLFASQTEDLRDRDVGQATRATEQRRGLELYVKGPLPSTFLLERIEIEEKGTRRTVEEDTTHIRVTVEHRPHRDWLTEFFYDREQTDEVSTFLSATGVSPPQQFPDTKDEFNITNLWSFGPEDLRHTLSGSANFLSRSGFFENRVTSIDQRLELAHTKTFTTFYAAALDINRTEAEEDQTFNAEIGFEKSIYDSLDIIVRGEIYHRAIEKSSERRRGLFFEADYRKKTPIGRYTSSLALGWERDVQNFNSGVQRVTDERVTLEDTTFLELDEKNITGSMAVTNEDKTITYAEIVDYILRVTGGTTEIRRTLGSLIGDGDTVLVTYVSQQSPHSIFTTDHVDWDHRLRLKKIPVILYANYRLRNEKLTHGEDPENLDREQSFLAGTQLDYKGLTTVLEHERQDQNLSPPWIANRVEVTYHRALARNLDLTVSGNLEWLRYLEARKFGLEPGAETLKTATGRLSLTTKVGRNAVLRFDSTLSRLSGRENRTEFQNSVSFEWRYAKLDFSVDAHYDTYTDENLSGTSKTTGKNASIMFYVRRKF
ncbi:hypothetical protein LCGC14_0254150 [marine sediment metagenome]|uniref:Outer membrane protein beta-barrel domain-containing protein n=1 Tax=marine sediment metagenome TaxID=412755 RepID=A0A0F9U8G9_9ZZZZ